MHHLKLSLLTLFAALVLTSCTKDEPPPPENRVPVVNAGPSKSITLPADSVTLNGSASDSDGHIVAYVWSKISGPTATTIVNPGAPTTVVKGLGMGKYVFQLLVTDNKGATGADTVSVTVSQAPVQTVTFQPSNNPFEWQVAINNGVDISSTNKIDIPVEAWTFSGKPLFMREVIKFDLSSIPTNATIESATLSLYSYPNPTVNGNLVDANYGTTNAMLVQQVASSWTASTINYASISGIAATQIVVPATTQSTLDLNIDVTNLVSSMVNTNANYGFFLKLQNEVTLNSRIFVSSYNTTYPTKHPKLVVTYH